MHLIIIVAIHFNAEDTFSLLSFIRNRSSLNHFDSVHGIKKRAIPGRSSKSNVEFSIIVVYSLFVFVYAAWLAVFLLCSGDEHPNPGILNRKFI